MSLAVNPQEGDEDESEEPADQLLASNPDADTTIIFMTGEGWSDSPSTTLACLF